MQKKINLNQEIESFKLEIKKLNSSFAEFENLFNQEKEKIDNLRNSFTYIIKLINHELIESINNSKNLIEELYDR